MNWYKQSQSEIDLGDEEPEWSYPGAEHDYNPYWSYVYDKKVEQKVKDFVEGYVNELKRDLFPQVGFLEDMKVAFVKLPRNAIAMYIDGTEPYIVIAIDISRIKRIVKKMNDLNYLEDHIKVTIVHELAHAIQQGVDIEYNEKEAESFARTYVDYGDIDRFWDEREPRNELV